MHIGFYRGRQRFRRAGVLGRQGPEKAAHVGAGMLRPYDSQFQVLKGSVSVQELRLHTLHQARQLS